MFYVSGGVAETINVSKFLAEDPVHTITDLFQTLRIDFDQKSLIVSAIKVVDIILDIKH